MRQVIGGEVVAEMLANEGVDRVFGIIDGTYLGFYAAFEKYGITLISPRHETSAAHMAGAYARLTGNLGVCMASNGPGVANILPGVAVENGEGNRVLLVTSCRRSGITYPDRGGAYQYFNQAAVTRAMSKWSGAVPSFERVPEFMRRAFRRSWSGRPGVVHVDIPESVFNGTFEIAENYLWPASAYRRTGAIAAPKELVEQAADALRGAERPLVHAGSGVLHSGASESLARVAELLAAPVITSWGARAALPDSDRHNLPIYAIETVKKARREADVVLVIGSRLGETDWWGKEPYWGPVGAQRVVQVDIDEDILGLNRPAEPAILADADSFLRDLAAQLEASPVPEAALQARGQILDQYNAQANQMRTMRQMMLATKTTPIHSAHVPGTCRAFFPDDAVLVIDGGNTAVWSNIFHDIKQANTVVSTHKFGMLGAGPGQAIGAKVARPDAAVYCIIGDGAMAFHAQELETALRHDLPVVFLVLCDQQWGMVKATQKGGLPGMRKTMGIDASGTINTDFKEIAFDDLARSMGCHGERIDSPDDLLPALERAVGSGKPAVIHVDVDPNTHLIVPGLQEFKDMHREPGT